jgi:hypothetical protein
MSDGHAPSEPRIPLWLKIGWTVWVLAWAPLHGSHYGAFNFLWFCDIGNVAIAVALWRESRLLFSWQAVSLLFVQAHWTIDVLGRLVLGFHPLGGSEYLFNAATPLHVRLLSLFHAATPPLLVWALLRLGYDRRAWLAQTLTCWVVLPLSYLGGPGRDINWTWGMFDTPQTSFSSGAYLAFCLAAYPLLLYLPMHLALRWLVPRWTTQAGRVERVTDEAVRRSDS